MAKQSGLGDGLYLGGADISGDIQQVGNVGGGFSPLDVTGINKSGIERIGGKRTGQIQMTTFFNDAVIVGEHGYLKTLPTTDIQVWYCRGQTLGSPAASVVAKQLNYDPSRGDDGSLTFAVDAQSNAFGLEWGRLHTAGFRTDTGATNGTGVDHGAASSNGLQAYMQVFAFTGTSATVTIQESSDNAAGDPYANVTGGAFTAVTAGLTWQRIATANNLAVERWLRVITTGTFSSFIFAVNIVRNETAVVF